MVSTAARPFLSDGPGPASLGPGERRTVSGKCPLIASFCPARCPQLGISMVFSEVRMPSKVLRGLRAWLGTRKALSCYTWHHEKVPTNK
jgi:hypothetical protein